MANIIIPKTNPVKYVQYELDASADSIRLDDRYNFDYLPSEREGKVPYAQKWRKGIPIRQQIWTQNIAIIYMKLVKCDGTVLATLYKSGASLTGYLVNGVAYDINKFDYDTSSMNEDEFYIILYYGQTEETLIKEISEKQQVLDPANNPEEMIIFKYSHSYNEYNTIFKTSYNSYFDQTFYFCVEGRAYDKNSEGIFTDFDDQRLNKTLLSAKPFDTWLFMIGGEYGCPEWVFTLLNFIRSCNTVYVDQYQVSFFDKWDKKSNKNYRKNWYSIRFAKTQTEYAKIVEVCDPVNAAALAMPDGYVGQPYIYTHQLSGSRPFTLANATVPLGGWLQVSIIDDILYIQTTAPAGLPIVVTDFALDVTIANACGEITLSDTFTVFPAIACTPVAFTGSNIYPAAVYNQPWNAIVGLSGTAPFTLTNVVKPAWLTLTATASGIEMSGTPNLAGPFTVSFKVSNCAGVDAGINYSQNFTIGNSVTITGYNDIFSTTNNAQSGQIFAAPGTLVTVELNVATVGTNLLTVNIIGATPSVPLVLAAGVLIGTFVMPASGFVGWSGTFTTSNPLVKGYVFVS